MYIARRDTEHDTSDINTYTTRCAMAFRDWAKGIAPDFFLARFIYDTVFHTIARRLIALVIERRLKTPGVLNL